MNTSTCVSIKAPVEQVWSLVTDIENSKDVITAINTIEIVEKGDNTKLGLKWRESRTMMGKEAIETMWISEIVENQYYVVLAENHGTKYRSVISLSIEPSGDTKLIMTFSGEAQGFFTKILSAIMMPFFKGSITKMLQQDLLDIKHHIENAT